MFIIISETKKSNFQRRGRPNYMEARAREGNFDLKVLFEAVKKRAGLILTITLIAVIVSGVMNYYFMTPIYQAKTELLVSQENSNNSINNSEVQANITIVNTYREIIKSPRILDVVGKQLGLSEAQTESLGKNITVNSVKNSQVISITVQNPSQKQAVAIANAIAKTFKEDSVNLMKVNNVQILNVAKEKANALPIKPNKPLNIAITLVVALFASIVLALLLEYLDNTLKSEQDIENVLELPVLGSVPQINESKGKRTEKRKRPYEVSATRGRRA